MKLNNLLVFIQRFNIIESEVIILMISVQLLLKWFSLPDMSISYFIWLQLIFLLTVYPTFYLTKRINIKIWLASMIVISIITGYWVGITNLWLPVGLGIWRSISVANEMEYLVGIYKRVIIGIVLLTLTIMITQVIEATAWWAIPYLAMGCFGCAIIGMACHNLLEQYNWKTDRKDWLRIFRNQLLFAVGLITMVVFLVIFRNKFISLAYLGGMVLGKLVLTLITPIIILFSKVINFIYAMIQGEGNRKVEVQFTLSEIFSNLQVKEVPNREGLLWVWIILSILVITGFLILLIRKFRHSFWNENLKNDYGADWVDMIGHNKEQNKQNPLFPLLKNVFARDQKLDKVRLLYRDFLKQYYHVQKEKGQPKNPTTRDLLKKSSEELRINMEQLKHLTKIYEDHRYGGKESNPTTIDKMKESVENWLKH